LAELKRGIIAGMIAGIVVGLITLLIIPKNFPIWDSGYQFRVYVFPILGFIMGIGFGAAYAMIYDLLSDISGKVKATIAVVSICIIRWPIDFALGYRYIATGLVSSLLFGALVILSWISIGGTIRKPTKQIDSTLGKISLSVGIFGVCISWVPLYNYLFNFLLGPAAIIFGAITLIKKDRYGFAGVIIGTSLILHLVLFGNVMYYGWT